MREKTNVIVYRGCGGGTYVSWKCATCGLVGSNAAPEGATELTDKVCDCEKEKVNG